MQRKLAVGLLLLVGWFGMPGYAGWIQDNPSGKTTWISGRMTHRTNLHKIKFIAHRTQPQDDPRKAHTLSRVKLEGSGLAMAFILARNWGRSCFSCSDLPVGTKGGSLRTLLRESPDLGLKRGMGWKDVRVKTSKNECSSRSQAVEQGCL